MASSEDATIAATRSKVWSARTSARDFCRARLAANSEMKTKVIRRAISELCRFSEKCGSNAKKSRANTDRAVPKTAGPKPRKRAVNTTLSTKIANGSWCINDDIDQTLVAATTDK